ncbi:MAG TPA: hypothetical protein DDZ51_00270 [Planctomycetaceae bacterium]|nr:hypothetical protein [Planctomycetaceae bacterium]
MLHDSSGNARHGKIHGATWIEWDLQRPILVQPGQPLAPRAVVHRPTPIPGLQSWSIESPSIQDACVSSVAWHPSGEWFIALDSQGILRVWGADGQLSQVIHACQVTGGSPGNAAFFDNGNLLATLPYSGDGILRIWETSTWKCVREIKTPQSFSPTGIASSTAGRRLAVAGGRGVLLVDPLTQQMSEASLDGHCNAVAVSPDGKTLIVARESGNALLWIDAESLKTLHTVELSKETDQRSRYGTHLAFSPDGRWVACSTVDGVVQLFDAETTEQKGVFKPGVANCYTLEWFQDSRRFAVASGGVAMVSVWDITQPDAPLLKTGDGNVIALSISPDQSEIIYHSTNRELYSLNLASGLTRRAINQQGLVALSPPVALSQQGDRLADLHRGVLTVWDSETGQPLQRLGGVPDSTRLSWSPSGQQIVASNWNTAEGKPSLVQLDSGETIQPTNQPRMVWSTAWSPDGKWLAIGGKDQPIEIVTAQTGEVVRQFGDESKSAFSLVWSPDGESLAAWTMDRFVRVWNTATGTVKAEENQFADPPGMYFNYQLLDWYPDNRRLCLALFTNVTIWDIETGEQSPLEHFSSGGSLAGVSLAPDGSSLLVYDGGGRYFWRGATTDNRKSLGPLGSNPAWHPDSRRAIVNRTSGIFTASSFGYDTSTFEKLGTSLRHFPGGGWIVIGPEGHYRGGVLSAPGQPQGSGTTPEELAKIERHIVYTTLNEDGTRSLYTPAEFRATFNWQNDPNKATLLTVPSSPPTPP